MRDLIKLINKDLPPKQIILCWNYFQKQPRDKNVDFQHNRVKPRHMTKINFSFSRVVISTFDRIPLRRMKSPYPTISHINLQNNIILPV